MTSWEFPASDPVDVQVRVPAGDVTVRAVATQTATVTLNGAERTLDATRVEFGHGVLSVIVPERLGSGRSGDLDIAIEVPETSSCQVHTASADVRCTGELRDLDVRTASGDVSAERVTGVARAHTASGDVHVGDTAEADLTSASGDLGIGVARGPARAKTASGDVRIDSASGSWVEASSTSGDIVVAVPPGIGVYLDLSTLSGTVRSELETGEETGGAELTVSCRTLSGDVQLIRAGQPAAR